MVMINRDALMIRRDSNDKLEGVRSRRWLWKYTIIAYFATALTNGFLFIASTFAAAAVEATVPAP